MWLPLLFCSPALAIDLTTVVDAWTVTEFGTEGEATAVAFDGDGDIVVVGWADGDNGEDAMLVEYDLTGTPINSLAFDAGEVGPTLQTSDDRWNDLAIDAATQRMALCGQRGTSPPVDTEWLVTVVEADAVATEVWAVPYTDSNTSLNQACEGVLWGTSVHAAGWSDRDDTIVGQWMLWQYSGTTGLVEQRSFADFTGSPAVADRSFGIDQFPDGTTAVAGATADGALLQRRDGATVEWAYDFPASLDSADAVAIDALSGRALVGGVIDNGSDLDGAALVFNQEAIGAQSPLWDVRWEGPESEGITGVAIDDEGVGVVVGWVVRGGEEHWRLVRYDLASGKELQSWEGPSAGVGRPANVAIHDGRVVIVGQLDMGTGTPEFALLLMDIDSDGDLIADVVDGCVDDIAKSEPGVCGCGIADNDTDGDGTLNCEEACGADPTKTEPGICGCDVPDDDSDGDGTADCLDECEDDPNKSSVGVCGCEVPDSDEDNDGYLVCQDQCPDSAPGAEVNLVGCDLDDGGGGPTGDTAANSAPKLDSGCGCQQGGWAGWWLGMVVALAARRRTQA